VPKNKASTIMSEPDNIFYPNFTRPPLVEVVCGILFGQIPIQTPHIGLLWQKFQPEYPLCQEFSPLAPVIEQFEEKTTEVEVTLSNLPPLPRVWFLHENDKEIIQIQKDRFIYNWKQNSPEENYPKHEKIFLNFRENLNKLVLFLEESHLGSIIPLQYEITYINHLPQGEAWQTLKDLGQIFPDFNWQTGKSRLMSTAESISWKTSFLLPDKMGRLHVTIRSAKRSQDNHPLILLELTARGIGKATSVDMDMDNWFNTSHQKILAAFTELTSEDAQVKLWGRK
jgi:uncharacterized protein (TIGR04255 family)